MHAHADGNAVVVFERWIDESGDVSCNLQILSDVVQISAVNVIP